MVVMAWGPHTHRKQLSWVIWGSAMHYLLVGEVSIHKDRNMHTDTDWGNLVTLLHLMGVDTL